MRSNETGNKVLQAIRNIGRDDDFRTFLEHSISRHLDSQSPCKEIRISPEFQGHLTTISDFTATARPCVSRDRNHNLLYQSRPEIGTRLGKQLAKLFGSLSIVRGKQEPEVEDLRTVARVAEDCLPPNRLAVLRCLRTSQEPSKTSKIARLISLPWSTAKQTLKDLEALGMIVGGPKNKYDTPGNCDQDPTWQLTMAWWAAIADLPILVS